jgi:hypothetical protein
MLFRIFDQSERLPLKIDDEYRTVDLLQIVPAYLVLILQIHGRSSHFSLIITSHQDFLNGRPIP